MKQPEVDSYSKYKWKHLWWRTLNWVGKQSNYWALPTMLGQLSHQWNTPLLSLLACCFGLCCFSWVKCVVFLDEHLCCITHRVAGVCHVGLNITHRIPLFHIYSILIMVKSVFQPCVICNCKLAGGLLLGYWDVSIFCLVLGWVIILNMHLDSKCCIKAIFYPLYICDTGIDTW